MPRSLRSLDQIYYYLRDKDAPRAAREITTELWNTANSLSRHPNMGKPEFALRSEKETYRSLLVKKNYRIIYYCEDQTIYIIDIWDVRQDPSRLEQAIHKP